MRGVRVALATVAIAGALTAATAGPEEDLKFGSSVSSLGDVNGDGVPDFAAGALDGSRKLAVCSGKDAKVLWSADGCSAGAIPDENGDGLPEVAVGTIGSADGCAIVHDGKSGSEVRKIVSTKTPRLLIAAGARTRRIASVGDQDGDGKPDLLVIRVEDSGTAMGPEGNAFVVALDGTLIADLGARAHRNHWIAVPWYDANGDGRIDFLVQTSPDQSHLGMNVVSVAKGVLTEVKGSITATPHVVAPFADLDKDGKPELLFGNMLAKNGEKDYAGEARIVSGKDPNTKVRVVKGQKEMEALGTAFCVLVDADGDAVPDFVAGGPGGLPPKAEFGVGVVRAFSGKSGKELWAVFGAGTFGSFGAALAAIGDTDGDGVSEVVAGAPGGGYLRLLSGKTGEKLGELRGAEVR